MRQAGFVLIHDETMQHEEIELFFADFRTLINKSNMNNLFDFAFDLLRLFSVTRWKLRGGLKLFLNIRIGQQEEIIRNDRLALLKSTKFLTQNNMFFEKYNRFDKNGETRFVLIDNCYYSYLWNGITLQEIDEDEFDEIMRVTGFDKRSRNEFELEPVDFYAFVADKKRTSTMHFVDDFTSKLLR